MDGRPGSHGLGAKGTKNKEKESEEPPTKHLGPEAPLTSRKKYDIKHVDQKINDKQKTMFRILSIKELSILFHSISSNEILL